MPLLFRLACGVRIAAILAVAAITIPALEAQGHSGNANPTIAPTNTRVHGETYGEWSALWWKWALEQPTSANPLVDTTGANCMNGQMGHVWFLAGTKETTGPITRTCTIPTGTWLFFPAANSFNAADSGTQSTFAEQQAAAVASFGTPTEVAVTIDGRAVQAIPTYRTLSTEFSLHLPEDNIYAAPAGEYKPAAAVGYYLMLNPLSPGDHVVTIHANVGGTIIDVKYHLRVAP